MLGDKAPLFPLVYEWADRLISKAQALGFTDIQSESVGTHFVVSVYTDRQTVELDIGQAEIDMTVHLYNNQMEKVSTKLTQHLTLRRAEQELAKIPLE